MPQKTENSNENEEYADLFAPGGTLPNGQVSNDLLKGTFIIQPYTNCENVSNEIKDWNKRLCSDTSKFARIAKTCPVCEIDFT